MDVKYVNPFIDAVNDTFTSMCGLSAKMHGRPQLRGKDPAPVQKTLAIIGLSGDVVGAVIMTMPMDIANKAIEAFIGEPPEDDAELCDAIGEIINIFAGAAGAKLGTVDLSLPTVMIGDAKEVYTNTSAPWIVIPMMIESIGEIAIEISMTTR